MTCVIVMPVAVAMALISADAAAKHQGRQALVKRLVSTSLDRPTPSNKGVNSDPLTSRRSQDRDRLCF
jgi:hypothetical protein